MCINKAQSTFDEVGSAPSEEANSGIEKRQYVAPRVTSAECMEAAAATCAPSNSVLGKDYGPGSGSTCQSLGS